MKDENDRFSIAPGEGKVPTNMLEEKDWDLKSFPCLLPDGNNSLHTARVVKLSEQDYFIQRIMNQDPRFASNPGFVFAITAYLEKKTMESRKGLSFKRGRANVSSDGTKTYSLEDPCSVLDNVKNTHKTPQKNSSHLIFLT